MSGPAAANTPAALSPSRFADSLAYRYGSAILSVALVTLLAWWLTTWFTPVSTFPLYYFALIGVALYAGIGPGLLNTLLAGLAGYFLLAYADNPPMAPSSNTLRLILFLLVGILISLLADTVRRARRHAETLLDQSRREAAQNYQLAFDAAHMGSWDWDLASNRVRWFGNMEAIHGLAPNSFPGTYDAVLQLIHPDDRPLINNPLDRVAAGNGPDPNIEYRILRPDGSIRWLLARGKVVYDDHNRPVRVVGVTMDITDRKRADEALRQSEARLRSILDTAADGIITIDERGRITGANHAAERLFGYTLQDMLGQNVKMLMPNPYRDEHDGYLRNYFRTGVKKIIGIGREVVGQRKDGSTFPMYLAVSEVVLGDRRIFTGLVHDISERKRYEAELRQAKETADAARAEAERANRMKDEFLATLSHELRTPLNAMLGWARLLRSDNLDTETQLEAVEAIERNAMAQSQLIEDLLDVSRIISGKLHLNVRPVDLPAVIAAAIDTVRHAADAKQILLERRIAPSSRVVLGDATRLQQVVWNLLANAIKFTPHAGRVTIRLDWTDTHAQITVSDTGKGISPEFLPHVFERFSQADASSTRVHGGLGLGLAIVRHIVEAHGGAIDAHSAGEGQGATFTVQLPLAAIPHPPRQLPRVDPLTHPGEPTECPPTLRNLKALVVDDEPDTCRLIKTVLERCHARVQATTSSAEALELLPRFKPDVLVCDLGLPGEDGYTLIRRIRALPGEQGGQTPALAFTAFTGPDDRDRALAAGFQRHLPKPAHPTHLLQAIATLAPPPPNGHDDGSPKAP